MSSAPGRQRHLDRHSGPVSERWLPPTAPAIPLPVLAASAPARAPLPVAPPFRMRLDAHDVGPPALPPSPPSPTAVRFLLGCEEGRRLIAEMHRIGLVDPTALAAYAATGRRRPVRPPVTPDVLTVAQASAALGWPERTVRRWLRAGRLQGRQDTPRGVWRVDAESVRSLQSVAA